MTNTVGGFGLGLVGMALAERLLEAGQCVFGCDVDEAWGALLAEMGGTSADPETV